MTDHGLETALIRKKRGHGEPARRPDQSRQGTQINAKGGANRKREEDRERQHENDVADANKRTPSANTTTASRLTKMQEKCERQNKQPTLGRIPSTMLNESGKGVESKQSGTKRNEESGDADRAS